MSIAKFISVTPITDCDMDSVSELPARHFR